MLETKSRKREGNIIVTVIMTLVFGTYGLTALFCVDEILSKKDKRTHEKYVESNNFLN